MPNKEEQLRYQIWRDGGKTHQQYIDTYDVDQETADDLREQYHRHHPLPPAHTTFIIRVPRLP